MKLDIKSISNGKAKDIILESIVRKENNLKQTKEFQKELFLNATLDDVNFLLKSIVDSKLDLIKVNFGNETYVTEIGHINPFLKNGGFEKIEAEEIQKNRKDIIDFKISNFKYYTFWPLFLFAFVGFGFSVSNFISNRKNQENTKLKEQRIEQMELELTKLQTSILNQKNLDSLHNPKGLTKKIDK
ncbi:hypothetical protein [Flavobacterium cellulosilyticum]|uniref:Uncharacterized protein n=1 Tax=Flavobacterium cellulosilyticum TaxID=2541731 RepID=A0A4R5CA12_9FLAO|nr:hypothetical protein [Flavobacterium cellulosilyticum]TDD96145.1 hypothetical protein E0F76_11640 [Flavobacterium cellulosilyticum]